MLLLFHGPLLRGMASLLTFEDQPASFDDILVFGGDRCFDEAAEMYRADSKRRVLLLEEDGDRLVQLGIVPSWQDLAVRQLTSRGVPSSQIVIIPRTKRQSSIRQTADWLESHESDQVLVLCDRLGSRLTRQSINNECSPAVASRLLVHGLVDRRFSEANWWRSIPGIKSFFHSSFDVAYYWLSGEEDWDQPQWDPDEYEKSLK